MAAAAASINPNEISSRLISHVDFIALIYKLVKEAGQIATVDSEVKENQNKLCLYEVGSSKFKDRVCIPTTTEKDIIEYSADDIFISGGAVLNIYDSLISDFKRKRGIEALKEYITRDTLDIDIKWWPRIAPIGDIVALKSDAITKFIEKFKGALEIVFNTNKNKILDKIKKYSGIDNVKNELDIEVKYDGPFEIAGANPINIILFMYDNSGKKYKLDICDISVYNNSSSQQFDVRGNEVITREHMSNDPVYLKLDSSKKIEIDKINIIVPNIKQYVEQQLFAFNNLIKQMNRKALINYRRVIYIKLLLEHYIANTTKASNLTGVINTNSRGNVENIAIDMNNKLDRSIKNNYLSILTLCNNLSKTINDSFFVSLCKYTHSLKPIEVTKKGSIHYFFPKDFIKSSNGILHPVFDTEEEENKWISIMDDKMRPVKGAGLKKRTHRRKHKPRKHKTRKHPKK